MSTMIVGLFEGVETAARAGRALNGLSLPAGSVTTISAVPLPDGAVVTDPVPVRFPRIVIAGWFVGAAAGLGLTLATYMLYPLVTGGKTIVSVPPTLIITYEVAMLGALLGTLIGGGREMGLMPLSAEDDPRSADPRRKDRPLRASGGRGTGGAGDGRNESRRGHGRAGRGGGTVRSIRPASGYVSPPASSSSRFLRFSRFPAARSSTGTCTTTRRSAPRRSRCGFPRRVPSRRKDWSTPRSRGPRRPPRYKNPEKVTEFALLTGKELFGIYCTPCHGESGKGDGPVAKKFVPTPADISATGHGSHHPEGDLFAIVTHGKDGMPPFRSDLTAKERWLVVAYLRTLK